MLFLRSEAVESGCFMLAGCHPEPASPVTEADGSLPPNVSTTEARKSANS